MLLDLMCSPALLKNADRMLVVCNKTDAMPDDLAGILPKNLVRRPHRHASERALGCCFGQYWTVVALADEVRVAAASGFGC